MRKYLTYDRSSDIFEGGEFRPFVKEYFLDVKFEGFGCGYYFPTISISGTIGNVRIKDLPKSWQPYKIESLKEYKKNL